MINQPPKELHGLIMGAIKRVYRRSAARQAVLKAAEIRLVKMNKDGSTAKKDAVFYVCSGCGGYAKIQANAQYPKIEVDHIAPVIPIDRPLESWDEFMSRLFCNVTNLMALCTTCHRTKSKLENEKRRYAAKLRNK